MKPGYAEVSSSLWTPFELYADTMRCNASISESDSWFQNNYNEFDFLDDIYGYEQSKARIMVDRKVATGARQSLPFYRVIIGTEDVPFIKCALTFGPCTGTWLSVL